MLGLTFRPQHPIDIFIADFYCHPVKLVVEIDGGIHKSKDQKEYDIGRTGELNNWEIEVVRYTNEEIENEMSRVLKDIKQFCLNRKSELPQSPLQGIPACRLAGRGEIEVAYQERRNSPFCRSTPI